MKTNNPQLFKEPSVARICQILAWLGFMAGGTMVLFSFTQLGRPAPDTGSFLATAFALLFGSLVGLVIARVIILLAQIAHNTAPV
jgi:hypothetical protein